MNIKKASICNFFYITVITVYAIDIDTGEISKIHERMPNVCFKSES